MGGRLTAALQAIRLTHRSVGIIIVGGGRIVVDENARGGNSWVLHVEYMVRQEHVRQLDGVVMRPWPQQ